MAQSRPPPTPRGTASPPLSTSSHHSKHHSRRKSGNTEEKREKKSARPAALSSRKGSSHNVVKVSRRETRERDEGSGREDGESFPMFCMTCEKQFLPQNSAYLYCSETCRMHDNSHLPHSTVSPPHTPYLRTTSTTTTPIYEDGGPDIIPRFSPTQSRPRSYFNSDPYPASPPTYQTSKREDGKRDSTALASLRELATALPKTEKRDDNISPPTSLKRTGSGVWDYLPSAFTSSKTQPSTPSGSYTSAAPYTVSQSYSGAGRSREDLSGYGYAASGYGGGNSTASAYGGYAKSHQYSYANLNGMGMDRPLPQRGAPGGYGHRPRSIDLVTPFSVGQGGGY